MSHYNAYVERAKALAHEAHAGQVDKAGEPYINHVSRVAAAVSDDPLAECVAWLHDVVEDCPDFQDALTEFPLEILHPVSYLTRWPWMTGDFVESYYQGIRGSSVALRVKLADIADNSDPARLAKLDAKTAARLRRKYAGALVMLGAA